jgi:hypothetical protein
VDRKFMEHGGEQLTAASGCAMAGSTSLTEKRRRVTYRPGLERRLSPLLTLHGVWPEVTGCCFLGAGCIGRREKSADVVYMLLLLDFGWSCACSTES